VADLTKKKPKKFYVPRNHNYSRKYEKSRINPIYGDIKKNATQASYTNANIETYLKNPYANYLKLQELSNYFWRNSPFYQNVIYYLGTLLAFDYVLAPILSPSDVEKLNVSALKKRLYSSAYTVKNTDVRCQFAKMMIRMLLNGETYWYDMSDSKNNKVRFEEIPSEYCQLAYIDDDGLWRYYVNLSEIPSTYLSTLPNEIKIAYKRYIQLDHTTKKEKVLNRELGIEIPNYLHLVGDKGVAMFVHQNKHTHDYPFLASMFPDLNTFEYNKSYMDEYLKEHNIKLVHLKIPTDKETGEPLLDHDFINEFHESAKDHLPSSTAPLTNPFEVQTLNFDKVQDSALNVTKNAREQVQFGSGVSGTLFDATTTNGLGYSIETDASKLYPLLSYFNDLMNFKINNNKFTCTFLQIHRHNKLEWHKQYATDLLNGGQRSFWLATNGVDLYDSLMISEMEKMLDFDGLLPPKLNASQGNAEDLDNNGRPKKDEGDKSDSTVVGENYT
jgi:hypothetical protein